MPMSSLPVITGTCHLSDPRQLFRCGVGGLVTGLSDYTTSLNITHRGLPWDRHRGKGLTVNKADAIYANS